MISSKTKFSLLVAVHIVGGLLFAWAFYHGTRSYPPVVGLFAVVLADAGLMGIWAALGITRLSWRLLAVVAGAAYLCALILIAFEIKDVEEFVVVLLIVTLPTTVILLVLSGFRHSRRRLGLGRSIPSSSATEGFQFSIRQLLVATAVAAGLLALSRVLGHLPTTGVAWQITVFFAVTGPYFILIELATLWAALGIGRPLPRLLVVLPTAFVVGTMPPFFLNTPLKMYLDWKDFIAWSCFMGLQATITAVSLLVIRSCGWRLVRMKGEPVLDQSAPYSEPLAERLRQSLAGRLEEKEFALGGVRFLLNGHMCLGVWKNSLVARIGPEQAELALKQEHVSEFNVTGQPMRGLVLVAPEGVGNDDQLNDWIRRAEKFVVTLPGN